MPQVVIENPVLNSPYAEPTRHFHFTDEGITSDIDEGRRVSSHFIPIPRAKKKNPKQLAFETEWTQDRIKENELITNFHAFGLRERIAAGKLTKSLLTKGETSPFVETPDQMVRRVCRELGNKKNIIVINDEAHHCYRRKPEEEEEHLTGDKRKEAERREEEARVWITGLTAVKAKLGLKVVHDLSATPFFLRGSGYNEGTLFPWVVSDFSLIDAIECGIVKVPRVTGYRYDLPAERLTVNFIADSRMAISTADLPTRTEMSSIIGDSKFHDLYDLHLRRMQEVEFLLASHTLEKYFRDDEGNTKAWFFPQLIGITRRWLAECVTYKDNTFPQLFLLTSFAEHATDRIYQSIVMSAGGDKILKPILRPYDTLGSTRYVDFDTTRAVYTTHRDKCHISHVALEEMDEVICYVKNQGLGFTIPYIFNAEEHRYMPDYIVRLDDGHGQEDALSLILEVSGEARKDKVAKVATARNLWAPAINNHGGFGRWAFIEITDPWDAKNTMRAMLRGENVDGIGPLIRMAR